MVDIPSVSMPGDMHAWWRDDVSAIAANVDARGDPAGAVAQTQHVLEQDVLAATAGKGTHGMWQPAMLGFQSLQRLVAAVPGIDIQDEEPRDLAGGDSDVCRRPAAPPGPNPFGRLARLC